MEKWLEIIPPIAAILGIIVVPHLFPQRSINEDLSKFETGLKNPEKDLERLEDLVENHVHGWQVSIDLLYTFLASLAFGATRFFLGKFDPFHPIAWVLIVALLINIFLLVVCSVDGPASVETMPKFFGYTLSKWSIWFCYFTNFALGFAIVAEVYLFAPQPGKTGG